MKSEGEDEGMVDLIDCSNEPDYNKDYHYMFENDWYESPTQPWS